MTRVGGIGAFLRRALEELQSLCKHCDASSGAPQEEVEVQPNATAAQLRALLMRAMWKSACVSRATSRPSAHSHRRRRHRVRRPIYLGSFCFSRFNPFAFLFDLHCTSAFSWRDSDNMNPSPRWWRSARRMRTSGLQTNNVAIRLLPTVSRLAATC